MKLNAAFILALFLMSLFAGIIIISIGIGSAFTPINTVMAPLVCPGDKIIPVWEYRGSLDTGVGPDLRYRWVCGLDHGNRVDPAPHRSSLLSPTHPQGQFAGSHVVRQVTAKQGREYPRPFVLNQPDEEHHPRNHGRMSL